MITEVTGPSRHRHGAREPGQVRIAPNLTVRDRPTREGGPFQERGKPAQGSSGSRGGSRRGRTVRGDFAANLPLHCATSFLGMRRTRRSALVGSISEWPRDHRHKGDRDRSEDARQQPHADRYAAVLDVPEGAEGVPGHDRPSVRHGTVCQVVEVGAIHLTGGVWAGGSPSRGRALSEPHWVSWGLE